MQKKTCCTVASDEFEGVPSFFRKGLLFKTPVDMLHDNPFIFSYYVSGGLMQQVHKGFEKESPPKKMGTPLNSLDATLQRANLRMDIITENEGVVMQHVNRGFENKTPPKKRGYRLKFIRCNCATWVFSRGNPPRKQSTPSNYQMQHCNGQIYGWT